MLTLSKLITYFDKHTLNITLWAIFCFFLYICPDPITFIWTSLVLYFCINFIFNTALRQARYRYNKKLQQRKV